MRKLNECRLPLTAGIFLQSMTCRVTEVFMDASEFEPVQGLGTRCWSVGRSPVPRAKTDARAFRRLTNSFELRLPSFIQSHRWRGLTMVQKREPPPRAILESERLLSMHISQDQKVPNVKFLIRAVAIALNEVGKRLA